MERIGPYKIIGRIGAGGMGEVFRGVHEETGQVAAVKLLTLQEGGDPHLLKRFRREIVSAGRLSHDNIVRLYDSGEQDEHIWYSMEYIEGQPLSELLEAGEAMAIERVFVLAEDLCKAFVYLHSRGYVHRDIKPGNIMVTPEGRGKLVDFGLVKSKFATNITVTGIVIGTPAFMSPEMLQGREVDHRSDIFQLGQVIYKMATGKGAFEGANSFDAAQNCLISPPVPPTERSPRVTPELEAVILHCLEKKPQDRYQSAGDMLSDLRRAANGQRPLGPPHAVGAPRPPRRRPQSARSGGEPAAVAPREASTPARGRSLGPGIGIAAALVLAGSAALAWLGTRSPADTYDVRDLQVEAGLRAARVTWESQHPYPTRAIYAPVAPGERSADLAGPRVEEAANLQEAATTGHELLLSGLEPTTDYLVQVVFPEGGRSLPHPFRTAGPKLGARTFSHAPDGTPVLTVEAPVPIRLRVRYGDDGSEVEASGGQLSTTHSVALTGAELFGAGALQATCEDRFGARWTVPPISVPDLREQARDLRTAVLPLRSRLLERIRKADEAERERRLDPAMLQGVLPAETGRLVDAFVPVGPLYFSSRKVPVDQKALLYDQVLLLDALDRFAVTRGLGFDSGARRLLGPEFGPVEGAEPAPWERQELGVNAKLLAHGISDEQVDVMTAFGPASRQIELTVPLEGAALVRRVQLVVKGASAEGIPFEEEVHVDVNGRLELVLRRPWGLPPSNRELVFVHGFDPRVLAEGTNHLRFTLHPLPGLRSATEIHLRTVALAVIRDG